MKEILESTTGFKAPPDRILLKLLEIKKIALKMKTTEGARYLNFDYYKKRNKLVNENWIRKRK